MTSTKATPYALPARCLINRDLRRSDRRWHLSDHHSVVLLAAVDLWDVLRQAHTFGFEQATINDNGHLYLLTIVEME